MDDIPLPLPFLLDGATELPLAPPQALASTEQNGLPQWMVLSPDLAARQTAFSAAGADGICAPTGAANRERMAQLGFASYLDAYNRHLVAAAKQAAPEKKIIGTLSSTGLQLPPQGDTDMESLVSVYAEQVQSLLLSGVDLFLADSLTNIAEARAAILAVREQTDRPILVSFACDGEGRTETGSDILAALIICQGMGASGFGIGRFQGDLSELTEQVQRLSPYAQIPLMVLPHLDTSSAVWTPEAVAAVAPVFAAAGVRICGGGSSASHIAALRAAIDAIDFSRLCNEPPELDGLPCASEREAQFISPLVDVGEEIFCSPHFVEDLLAAEDAPTGASKIVLEDEDDLDVFASNQYMIQEALCLSSDNPAILEKALRVYNGRAFYDGTGALEPDALAPLVEKYGLIVL